MKGFFSASLNFGNAELAKTAILVVEDNRFVKIGNGL
jgi:hypothetical protein